MDERNRLSIAIFSMSRFSIYLYRNCLKEHCYVESPENTASLSEKIYLPHVKYIFVLTSEFPSRNCNI